MARKKAPAQKQKPARLLAPLPEQPAPLPAELLTAPRQFGQSLMAAGTTSWQYWFVPALAGVLSGAAYALLMRAGLNEAAQEAARAGKTVTPAILTHITGAFGSFFLTALTFVCMWGLGRLGSGPGRDTRGPKVAEVYSASFALVIPLYLLTIVLVLLTPASAWALDTQAVQAARGDLLKLQQAAVASAAQTPGALALILTSVLGTAAQFGLAYPALRETLGQPARALLGVLLPLIPALLVQFINAAPLFLSRR